MLSAWELQELYHASGRVEEAAKVLEKIAKKVKNDSTCLSIYILH